MIRWLERLMNGPQPQAASAADTHEQDIAQLQEQLAVSKELITKLKADLESVQQNLSVTQRRLHTFQQEWPAIYKRYFTNYGLQPAQPRKRKHTRPTRIKSNDV